MRAEPKPLTAKYPGNKWLVSKLDEFGIETTAPFVHGVIRGALANPVRMHPAEAFARIAEKSDPSELDSPELEPLALAMLYLWNDTAANYDIGRRLPKALSKNPMTRKDERQFNDEIIDLADGFLEGFCLVRIPPKYRSEACESYFLDIVNEAKICLNWYDNPEDFKKEYPDPDLRLTVLRGSLSMIEETMKWLQLYVRFAADDGSPFSGGVRVGRNKPCPCGSGRKYKKCCGNRLNLH